MSLLQKNTRRPQPRRLFIGLGLGFALCGAALRLIYPAVAILGLFLAGIGLIFSLYHACALPFSHPAAVRAGRILRACILTGLGIGLVSFVCIEGLILHYDGGSSRPGADYIFVLGAAVNGETPSLALQYRIDEAERYLKENPDTVAVLCGGQGDRELITEAEAMRRALTAAGIDGERLILEDRSTNTEQNIAGACALIPSPQQATVGIVTTGFHIYRARHLLQRQGVENCFGISARLPDLPLFHANYYLREYLAVVKTFVWEAFGF